jgi:hypothetical protein
LGIKGAIQYDYKVIRRRKKNRNAGEQQSNNASSMNQHAVSNPPNTITKHNAPITQPYRKLTQRDKTNLHLTHKVIFATERHAVNLVEFNFAKELSHFLQLLRAHGLCGPTDSQRHASNVDGGLSQDRANDGWVEERAQWTQWVHVVDRRRVRKRDSRRQNQP